MASPASPSSSMQSALQAAEQLSAALAEQVSRQQQQQQEAHINGFGQPHQQLPQPHTASPLMFQPPPKQHTAATPSSLILNSAHYPLPPLPAAMRQLHPAMMDQQHPQSIVHHNQHFYAPAAPAAHSAQHQQNVTLTTASRPHSFHTTSPFALLQHSQPHSPTTSLQPVSRSSSASSSPTSSTLQSGHSSPTSSSSSPIVNNGVLNLFDLLTHMRVNIDSIRSAPLSAQLTHQLNGLRDQMLMYRVRHERGEDMNREAHVVYREMRQFDEQISKHLTAQSEHSRLLSLVNFQPSHGSSSAAGNTPLIKPVPTTMLPLQPHPLPLHSLPHSNGVGVHHLHSNGHGGAGVVEERGGEKGREREARKERKRKRREGRDRTEADDEERRTKKAKKKKRRETEDTEARERRKRKHDKRKVREARKEAQLRAQLKETKRNKHKAKHGQQNGHIHSSSSSSSSSSSASDLADELSDGQPSGSRKVVDSGRRTQLLSSEKEQTVQALIATLHSKREKKKRSGKDSSRLPHVTEKDATPAATLVAAAIPAVAAITTSYRSPAFTVNDFADAFRHFTAAPPTMPPPFPPPAATATTGQLICPPTRQWVQSPPRADDDRSVQQRSTLLASFTFSPATVRSIMQRAMPADGECSEEAVQLVTQSVCQFIAFMTDEAEADVHMVDADDTIQPVAEHLSDDELPLSVSLSLRPPPLENERGEQSTTALVAPPPPQPTLSETDGSSSSSSSRDEITCERVLDALLRLGYDDYAVLSAHHIQLYRRQQQQQPNGGLLSPVSRIRSEAGVSATEELPVNLTSSYLLSNAHRIDMNRFLPSIPRHPVSDPRIELSVSSSTLALLPSSSSSSPPSALPTPTSHKRKKAADPSSSVSSSAPATPHHATDQPSNKPSKKRPSTIKPVDPSKPPKKAKFDPSDPSTSEASLVKSAAMKAAWSRKHALMQSGLTKEEASEALKREKDEERRVRQAQKHSSGKGAKKELKQLKQTQEPTEAPLIAAKSEMREGKEDRSGETSGVSEVVAKDCMDNGAVKVAAAEAVIDLTDVNGSGE